MLERISNHIMKKVLEYERMLTSNKIQLIFIGNNWNSKLLFLFCRLF